MEGVLVTGTAQAALDGECARCLEPISDDIEVTFQELFVYDDHATRLHPRRTTRSARSRTTCSTSSPCCGTRWCSHCRSSRCARTTVLGCAPNVARAWRTTRTTQHEAAIDPRWARLAQLEPHPEPAAPNEADYEEKTVAVPKRKMSRSNTRHRRSQWKAVAPTLVTCANPACGAKHLPHRACGTCGQYGASADRRQVL